MVTFLIEKGADPNKATGFGQPAFIVAIRFNLFEIVSLFIKHSMNINSVSKRGKSALMEAARLGHYEIVKLLVESGANLAQKDETEMMAIDHATKFKEIVEYIFDKNNTINNSIIYASLGGHIDTINFLLTKKAPLNNH